MHGTAQHSTLMAFLYQEASSERKEEKSKFIQHTPALKVEGITSASKTHDDGTMLPTSDLHLTLARISCPVSRPPSRCSS
jgi:hypothetical protein